jgi:hypothetical protein
MSDTSVHYYHSGLTGAPVLNNTAGSLIAVLDACLIDGWGLGNADSVTISGGIATLTRAAGHSAEVGSVMLISGATVTGGTINGERRVISVTSTSYTFAATGIPNQTATGTISQRIAPANWTKPFSGTNLAVYRAPDVTGNRFFLRVDDTATRNARVRGFETMSDVNTGTGPFPTTATHAGAGGWWAKNQGATVSPWVVVADGKTLYYAVAYYASSFPNNYAFVGLFGDLNRAGSADAFASAILCPPAEQVDSVPGSGSREADWRPLDPGSFFFARAFHGIGGAVGATNSWAEPVWGGSYRSGNATSGMLFPNPSDGGVYLSPVTCSESNTRVLRGGMPGIFAFPQDIGRTVFPNNSYLSGVAGYPGKTFRILNSHSGCWAFDMSGPWV